MSLLYEVALTPDVLCADGYDDPGIAESCLGHLAHALLADTVVRNLRDGSWAECCARHASLTTAGRHLIVKLQTMSRLRCTRPQLQEDPCTPVEWGYEALRSHETDPLDALLLGRDVSKELGGEPPAVWIEKLAACPWWQQRTCSHRLARTTSDYLGIARRILERADHIMFIDPFINPEQKNYSEFGDLVAAAARHQGKPLIEIHTTVRERNPHGGYPSQLPQADAERRFQPLNTRLKAARLAAEVFVWGDFHDRYLLTNLVGINVPNGFDVDPSGASITTWSRLSRENADDVQREFSPNTGERQLRYRFRIGQQ